MINFSGTNKMDTMKNLFLIIFFITVFLGCNNSQDRKVVEHYATGKERVVLDYKDPADSTTYTYNEYYENGKLRTKVDFVKGIKTGEQKYYRQNGTLSASIIFSDNGKCEYRKEICENGKTSFEGKHEDGLFQGKMTWYYCSGAIRKTGEKVDSKEHGHWISYFENGKIEEEGDYYYGIKTGIWKTYDSSGKLIKQEKQEKIRQPK
jgi:antitoxin component YwqK of YwqJK toxin-antitoxin module